MQYLGRYPHVWHRSPVDDDEEVGRPLLPPLMFPAPAELLFANLTSRPLISCLAPDSRTRIATSSGIVTKPKPRDRPVSRSMGMWHSKILSLPYSEQK